MSGAMPAGGPTGDSRIARRARELGPWFHNLHLPDGTRTAPDHPLGDFPAFKWRQIAPHVPENLQGWRALDIGCNAGFYSFELARRGAAVTAIDVDPRYLDQASWAAAQYGLEDRIVFERLPVYGLSERDEAYDLVLFLGVFYHLRYPLLALDLVARVVRRLLVFQSLTMPGEPLPEGVDEDPGLDERERLLHPGWPKMAFVERCLAGDPTNWWVPNPAAVEALLRSCGLDVVARPEPETRVCAPGEGSSAVQGHVGREEELKAATGRGGWAGR